MRVENGDDQQGAECSDVSCRLVLRRQSECSDIPGQLVGLRQDILFLEAEISKETDAAVQQISATVPHGHLGERSTFFAGQRVDHLTWTPSHIEAERDLQIFLLGTVVSVEGRCWGALIAKAKFARKLVPGCETLLLFRCAGAAGPSAAPLLQDSASAAASEQPSTKVQPHLSTGAHPVSHVSFGLHLQEHPPHTIQLLGASIQINSNAGSFLEIKEGRDRCSRAL